MVASKLAVHLLLVELVCCIGLLQLALCSEGDASQHFRICHANCMQTGCTKTPGNSNTCDIACPAANPKYQAPYSLQLMHWDCAADCAYNCMWSLEGPKAAARSGPVYKYYGKWPFIRVLGVQEIASVLFSIANMLAHLHCMYRYRRHVKCLLRPVAAAHKSAGPTGAAQLSCSTIYPYYWVWILYSSANVNAWWWSSVFHCRDTKLTEKFDYFSADITIAVGLAVSLVRTLQLRQLLQLVLLGLMIGSGLMQHVYYMSFIKFDYGYNMKLCISAGLITAAAWVVWATVVKHPGRRTVYQFIGVVHAAMLLEVLDFPPLLWLFDAHALWHAATVPLTYLWYKFVFADVAWLNQGGGACRDGRCSSNGKLAELGTKQKQ